MSGTRILAVTAVLALAASSQAALVAGDSYVTLASGANLAAGEYPNTAALSSTTLLGAANAAAAANILQTPGFQNGRYGSGSGTAQFSATTLGLSNAAIGATSAGSGKVSYAAASLDANLRSTARVLAPAVPASSTYWVSTLMNVGTYLTASGANDLGTGWVLAGFGNSGSLATGASGGSSGLSFGFAQGGTTGTSGSLIIRSRNSAGANVDTVLLSGATTARSNITYLVVAKIDVNTSANIDTVTWWLDPQNGGDEGFLGATALATGTFTGDIIGTGASDIARLNYGSFRQPSSAFFDEPRLSTDLAGLGFVVVPEPSGVAVAAIPALGLLSRRRRTA